MTLDVAGYKERLLDMQRELQLLKKIGDKNAQTVMLDQSCVGRLSRMDALQMQAMSVETNHRRALRLQRIDTVLKRIESGNYGICIRCDEDIHPKRLNVDPAVLLCIDCAD